MFILLIQATIESFLWDECILNSKKSSKMTQIVLNIGLYCCYCCHHHCCRQYCCHPHFCFRNSDSNVPCNCISYTISHHHCTRDTACFLNSFQMEIQKCIYMSKPFQLKKRILQTRWNLLSCHFDIKSEWMKIKKNLRYFCQYSNYYWDYLGKTKRRIFL